MPRRFTEYEVVLKDCDWFDDPNQEGGISYHTFVVAQHPDHAAWRAVCKAEEYESKYLWSWKAHVKERE